MAAKQNKKVRAGQQVFPPPTSGAITADVAVGSFAGHKGHQQLINLMINDAKKYKADSYVFIGSAVGKDDPIPLQDKIDTWAKMYPNVMSSVVQKQQDDGTEGSMMSKIKHELINPIPGKPPRYQHVRIFVGADRADMANWAQKLQAKINTFKGYEKVTIQVIVTERDAAKGGTGVSFTQCRNILKNPQYNYQQKLKMWIDLFKPDKGSYAKPLDTAWVEKLMNDAAQTMGVDLIVNPTSVKPAVKKQQKEIPHPAFQSKEEQPL